MIWQYGPYDSLVLNPDTTDEPFPVRPTIRSKEYEQLIIREAEQVGVLEDAKLMRDNL